MNDERQLTSACALPKRLACSGQQTPYLTSQNITLYVFSYGFWRKLQISPQPNCDAKGLWEETQQQETDECK